MKYLYKTDIVKPNGYLYPKIVLVEACERYFSKDGENRRFGELVETAKDAAAKMDIDVAKIAIKLNSFEVVEDGVLIDYTIMDTPMGQRLKESSLPHTLVTRIYVSCNNIIDRVIQKIDQIITFDASLNLI